MQVMNSLVAVSGYITLAGCMLQVLRPSWMQKTVRRPR
jgi:hypothetical protein